MMTSKRFWAQVAFVSTMFTIGTGCATIIRQDEVGVRDTFGAISEDASGPGLKFFFLPIWDITSVPIRTVNLEVAADLPSREGLTIAAEVSILYRIQPDKAPEVLGTVGPDYEQGLILPVFRSVIADVTAKFDAKDMHTGRRAEIEKEVRTSMMKIVAKRGFDIEAVLLKSIRLPKDLSRSIEARMQAEQDAARMQFILAQERQEAERKVIQASGQRDAQRIVTESLTPDILRLRTIEAMESMANSKNAKVVITDGRTPVFLESD